MKNHAYFDFLRIKSFIYLNLVEIAVAKNKP